MQFRKLAPFVVLALSAEAFAFSMAGCSSDAEESDVGPLVWVSPTASSNIDADDLVVLTVKVADPAVRKIEMLLDNTLIFTCDTSSGPDECRSDDLVRETFVFDQVGPHRLLTRAKAANGAEISASLNVLVRPPPAIEDAGAIDPSDGGDAGPVVLPTNRGFLDPDRPLHNVFGGVSWEVKSQRVLVASPPSLAVATVASCMARYGTSIVKHADAYTVSRASVLATAITESNCSNPSGSSDGLSSGPMQVTGSTCAGVVTGYTSAACKKKMFDTPDFSFMVGAKYMGSAYQKRQHAYDPPKIAAAYNAGSVRSTTANRWHMVVTGNHIDRFVAAYNAYREWEVMTGAAKDILAQSALSLAAPVFNGEHVQNASELPTEAAEGQVYFVGDWQSRNGAFVTKRSGTWE
jgi:Transglycosylase SLT domain